MAEKETTIDLSKEVDFTHPEGFMEAVASLDFLPDDNTRVQILNTLVRMLM